MNLINEHNYEAWFLDFYDGTLNVVQCEKLFQFLEKHPKLKSEFENFDLIILDPEPTPFNNHSLLKIEDENFIEDPSTKLSADKNIKFELKSTLKKQLVSEDDLIALSEGELSQQESSQLMMLIDADVNLKSQLSAFRLAKLQADSQLVYLDKAALRKRGTIIPLFVRYASIAAIFGGVLFFAWWHNQQEVIELATVKTELSKPNKASNVLANENLNVAPILQNNVSINEPEKEKLAPKNIETTLVSAKPENKIVLAQSSKPEIELTNIETLKIDSVFSVAEIITPDVENKIQIELPEELADNSTTNPIPTTTPKQNSTQEITSFSISKGLGHFARAAKEKISSTADKHIDIQRNNSGDEEYQTSTFKLGALEIHRSRSSKQ